MNCLDITHREFLDSANTGENYVRVNWPGRSLRPDILTRKCIIDSVDQWKDIIQVSYLPRYKDGKSPWEDPSQNFTLYEYSLQTSQEIRLRADKALENAPNKRITAAYDIKLDKRLILDGDHRARCDSENIEPRLDVRRGAVLLDKVIEVLDWATEHLAICEAVHHGVLVEGLGEAGNTLNSHYIIYRRNNNYSSV